MKASAPAFALVLSASALLLMGCGHGALVTAEWESLGGPRAQDVTALLLPGESSSGLRAATANGDIYATDHPEAGWRSLSTISGGSVIHRLVRDPDRPSTLFAATDEGLYVSTDIGRSWTPIRLSPGDVPSPGLRTLAIDPWNPRVMYAGTRKHGIRRSADGGATWSPVNSGIPGMDSADVYEILIDFARPDRLLAAVSALGVVRSTDGGGQWTRLTEEFNSTSSTCTHLVQDRQRPSTLLYGTNAGALARSTDGGATWSPARNGSAEGRILSLSVCASQPDLVIAGTESGLLLSRDFGSSWIDVKGDLPRVPVAAASPDGRTIYAYGEGLGLQRTTDGGTTWVRADARLGGSTVRLIATDQGGTHIYAALEHGVMVRDSATGFWRPASSGLPGGRITSLVVDADSSLHLYAATPLGGFQSRNGGTIWEAATRNLRVTPEILEPHPRIRTRMLAACDPGVYVSTDKGNTWQQSKALTEMGRVTAFTYAPGNAGTIYGASPRGGAVSKDGGFRWESSRFGIAAEDVCAVTLDDRDPAVVYAWTSSGGGFRSINGGLEWNGYAPPWKQRDTVLIAYDRYEPSSVVALVNNRDLYYSRSGGGTWFALPSNPVGLQALSLWWHAPTSTLYIGTKGNGMQRIRLGETLQGLAGG